MVLLRDLRLGFCVPMVLHRLNSNFLGRAASKWIIFSASDGFGTSGEGTNC